MGGHVALLGDSIFDNALYTLGQADVLTHLRAALPAGYRASLLAVDGSRTVDLRAQLERVSGEMTHLVVSVGGNDLLQIGAVLLAPVRTVAEALALLGRHAEVFEQNYRAALDPVVALGRDLTLCTVYEARLPAPQGEVVPIALRIFNDVILRYAFERCLRVLELRAVCTEQADFANPIEPSSRGGRKIARVIAQGLGLQPVVGPDCAVVVPR